MENKKLDQLKMEVPYFQVPNKIFDVEEIDTYEKLVYMYLARCANHGSTAFPSYNTIADKCSMSKRKAINCVKQLIEVGLIIKHSRKVEKDKNLSNVYEVKTPSECHAPPSEQSAPDNEHDAPNKELTDKELIDKEKKTYITPKRSSLMMSSFLSFYKTYNNEEHKAVDEYTLQQAEELFNLISTEEYEEVINAKLRKFFANFDYTGKRRPTLNYFMRVAGTYFEDEFKYWYFNMQ